jgi:hypothetical protein
MARFNTTKDSFIQTEIRVTLWLAEGVVKSQLRSFDGNFIAGSPGQMKRGRSEPTGPFSESKTGLGFTVLMMVTNLN